MKTLAQVHQYFDDLVIEGNDDVLFASSYIRGFLTLATCELPDSACFDETIHQQVGETLVKARSELSPQDSAIVHNFWQELKSII